MEFSQLVALLVCPACKGDLKFEKEGDREGFLCPSCQVVYPIVDEIPVMLIEESMPVEKWRKEARPQ